MKTTRKKQIKIVRGSKMLLAKECRCNLATIYQALRWYADTPLQNEIRERAKKYEKRF